MKKETPGQILVRLLDHTMNGGDPAELQKELQKATCEKLGSVGTRVTCGNYESADGEAVTERRVRYEDAVGDAQEY